MGLICLTSKLIFFFLLKKKEEGSIGANHIESIKEENSDRIFYINI